MKLFSASCFKIGPIFVFSGYHQARILDSKKDISEASVAYGGSGLYWLCCSSPWNKPEEAPNCIWSSQTPVALLSIWTLLILKHQRCHPLVKIKINFCQHPAALWCFARSGTDQTGFYTNRSSRSCWKLWYLILQNKQRVMSNTSFFMHKIHVPLSYPSHVPSASILYLGIIIG